MTKFDGVRPTTVQLPPQLRPSYRPLGLHWWETGVHNDADDAGGYSSNAHSNLLVTMTARVGVVPEDVRNWMMDTTNGNPAVLRERVWRNARYGECLQHVSTNAVRDLLKIPSFKAAHDSAQDLSTWIRRAPKRVEVSFLQSDYLTL